MNRRDRLRLAGETGIDPRTVESWWQNPASISSGLSYALTAACRKLGIELPSDRGAFFDGQVSDDVVQGK